MWLHPPRQTVRHTGAPSFRLKSVNLVTSDAVRGARPGRTRGLSDQVMDFCSWSLAAHSPAQVGEQPHAPIGDPSEDGRWRKQGVQEEFRSSFPEVHTFWKAESGETEPMVRSASSLAARQAQDEVRSA